MAAKEKQNKQVKQSSARATESEGETLKEKEAISNLTVKLNAARKRAEDIADGKGGLQARLQ